MQIVCVLFEWPRMSPVRDQQRCRIFDWHAERACGPYQPRPRFTASVRVSYGHELLRSLTTCNSALRRSSVRAHCYKTKRILDRSSGAQHSSRTLSRGICAQDNRACSCLTRLELQETGEKRIFGMWTGTSAAFTQRIRVCDLILSAHHQRLW